MFLVMKTQLTKLNKYISFLPFILVTALTMLIYEQVYAPNGIIFPNTEFIGFLFLVVANITLAILMSYIQQFDDKQKKIRLLLLYTLLVITALSLLNAVIIPSSEVVEFVTSDGVEFELLFNVSRRDRFWSVLLLFVSVSFIYVMALVLPRKTYFRQFALLISYSLMFYGLGITIYSFVTEFDVYIDLIKIGYANANIPVPIGPYTNRNVFASYLLTSLMFAIFLYFFYKTRKIRFLFIFLTIPLLVAIYFTFSKTNMVLSVLAFSLVFLRHTFLLLKRHKIRFLIETLVALSLLTFVLIFRLVPILQTTQVGRAFVNIIPDNLFEVGVSTMNSRLRLWEMAWEVIISRPRSFLLGDGIYISRKLYELRIVYELPNAGHWGFGHYHSGYFEIFHTFGFIGFLLYLIILFVLLIKIFIFMKKMPAPGFFLFISFIVFVSRATVEPIMLLVFRTESILASLALVFPYFYFTNLKQERSARAQQLIEEIAS